MINPGRAIGPQYGFGLYLHWPYCQHICPYCDFNVYAAKDRTTEPLFDAMLADLAAQASQLKGRAPLSSVYFGGGTPSLMSPSQIAQFIDACTAALGLSERCEITLEANPNDIRLDRAKNWKEAGINRISLGVQSLDDRALAFLGRDHTAAQGLQAVETVAHIFERYSVDLIYARPDQSLAAWREELTSLLSLKPPHLSLYELTIAPKTAFGKAAQRGTLIPLDEEAQADLYELTEDLTAQAGLPAYEISNYARSKADQSRHNLTYWRSGDWLGIGPGAHGRLSLDGVRLSTEGRARPQEYITAVQNASHPWQTETALTAEETAAEILTMGLRVKTGIEQDRVNAFLPRPIDKARLESLQTEGWLSLQEGRLCLTPSGRLLADRIALELLR